LPGGVDVGAEEAAVGGTPRFDAQDEGGAVEGAARGVGGELRFGFLDDEAAPLRGVEGFFAGETAEVVGGNGEAEELRVNESDGGGEEVEGGEGGVFAAGEDEPEEAREISRDERGGEGESAVEAEEAADGEGEADGEERGAPGEHTAGDRNGITELSQINGIFGINDPSS